MGLLLTLGRGALTGIGKKPQAAERAQLPDTRLSVAEVRVDPGRVDAYAKVCGFQGLGPALPLTYPHILGFPLAARIMAERDFPLPLMGLVHTSIEITSHRTLTVADRPELTVYAAQLRPHRRGTEVLMVTEARLGGEVVWEDRSAYLARHRLEGARHGVEGTPSSAASAASLSSAEARASEEPLPAVEEWRLPAGLGRRHARVSGDYNPIHLHRLTARPLGFRRAIAHGMWTVARCAAALPTASGISAEFRTPVLLPSTVTFARSGSRFQLRSPAGLHLAGVAHP
jgi:acyl dehydratase